jgi:5-methyltetrahydrofolate--homocysteine methyltransferase
MDGKRNGNLDPEFGRALGGRKLPPRKSELDAAAARVEIPARSDVATDATIFDPPFLGARVAKGISLDEIATYINETALFRNQWQFRPEKASGRRSGGLVGDREAGAELDPKARESDDEFKTRVRSTLRDMLQRAKSEGWLVPAVAWGYFPVNAEGDDLVVWTDDSRSTERTRFHFPRQHKDRFLCISDFFRPVDSGELDYAAFHVCTVGSAATEREQELFAANQYQDYLLTHGLSVEMTEALAELWHRRIREEWGYADEDGPSIAGLFRQQYRGSRYSWGYPACPDLEDQAIVAELLEIDKIGVALTEEFHLVPEQSTSAIIVPHPEAKYFVV